MWTQLRPKGHSPPPKFRPCLLWPNGWMDQDTTWYGGKPRPRRHCVRWGPSCPSPKMGAQQPPISGPSLLWPNGWMQQDVTWYGGMPQFRRLCVRWDPASYFAPSKIPLGGNSPRKCIPGDGQTLCKVWLTSVERRRCSNAAKTRNPLAACSAFQTCILNSH